MDKKYSAFSSLLEKAVDAGRDVCFRGLCREVGASPSDINELLEEELGMSGDELVSTLLSRVGNHQGKFHEVFDSKPFGP